ncbi:hypothetical protein BH23GEM10_BH23GEM10_12730 [soil metagenome]
MWSAADNADRSFEPGLSRQPVPDSALATRIDQIAMGTPAPMRADVRAGVSATIESPATLPYYRDVTTGVDGSTWIEEYPVSIDAAPRWLLLDAAGRVEGAMALPPRHEPLSCTRDRCLLRITDEYDVERPALARLARQ